MSYREPINSISDKEKEAVLALTKYFNDFWIIVDVGSNKGNFTDVLLQEREPSNQHEKLEIHLFEPNKLLLDYTKVKYEHTDKIIFHGEALSSTVEKLNFYYFEDNHSGISNLLGNWKELNPKVREIQTSYLDIYNWEYIDILKIDTEGTEISVLQGAKNLLKDKKIKFLQVECSPHNKNVKFEDIVQYLSQFGYKCWDYKDREFIEVSKFPEDVIDNFYFTHIDISKGSRAHIKMQYTEDWNEQFIKNTQFLKKKVEFAIEFGCMEGKTSNYICDELLVEGARLLCVDPLQDFYLEEGSDEETNKRFIGQYERFINNIREQPIELIRKKTQDSYQDLVNYLPDFYFIDANHLPQFVYKDASFAINHLKLGGYILLDDYNWSFNGQYTKDGIDKFLEQYKNYLEIIVKNEQVLVKKVLHLPNGN